MNTSTLSAILATMLLMTNGLDAQDSRKTSDPSSDIPADTEIMTTKSGLKYSVLKAGEGKEHPAMADKVTVHYTGWLSDGTKFDSSRDRGVASSFGLGQVIKGWGEGLQLMTVGSRFKFTIPSDLGYGPQGRPPTIPANAELIFDVELLSFKSMPKFPKANPEATKTTASGLKYEVLTQGEGELLQAKDVFDLDYAYWDANEKFLEGTFSSGRNIKGRIDDMRLIFLKEAPLLMRKGSVLRFEVASHLCFPKTEPMPPEHPLSKTTIWTLKLTDISKPAPAPEFSMPKADELTTTKTGLQYQVIKEGEGAIPRINSKVTVHYAGWLTDGSMFDASYQRGEPSSFGVTQVIAGWTEGLQLMREGSIYKFVIPSELAYGEKGRPSIPANSTLVFQVELIKVN